MRHLSILVFYLLPLTADADLARFEVGYPELQDRACAEARGYDINPEWTKELNEAIPVFAELWRVKGAAMFAAAASITRRSTDPYIAPIRLTLCDTPSQSFSGPSVNMRFALRSFTANSVPLRYKVDTAFHESLHAFVAQYVPRSSPLLLQHKRESACVLNHLHLLALQKATLLAINDFEALQQVISIDSQLPSGCYKRAWSLVNQSETTYQLYVAELREA